MRPNTNRNKNFRRGKRPNNRGHNEQSLGKQKSHATNQKERYLNMARDAAGNGERVDAEFYYQHVEHYSRVLNDIAAKEAERNAAREAQQTERAEQEEAEAEDTPEKEEASDEKPKRRAPRKKKAEPDEEIPLPDLPGGNEDAASA